MRLSLPQLRTLIAPERGTGVNRRIGNFKKAMMLYGTEGGRGRGSTASRRVDIISTGELDE